MRWRIVHVIHAEDSLLECNTALSLELQAEETVTGSPTHLHSSEVILCTEEKSPPIVFIMYRHNTSVSMRALGPASCSSWLIVTLDLILHLYEKRKTIICVWLVCELFFAVTLLRSSTATGTSKMRMTRRRSRRAVRAAEAAQATPLTLFYTNILQAKIMSKLCNIWLVNAVNHKKFKNVQND